MPVTMRDVGIVAELVFAVVTLGWSALCLAQVAWLLARAPAEVLDGPARAAQTSGEYTAGDRSAGRLTIGLVFTAAEWVAVAGPSGVFWFAARRAAASDPARTPTA